MNNNGVGTSSVIARHDYLPFGEEIGANVGMRTGTQGYNVPDANRQKYAMLERDATGLDHTWWRKYESTAGRWTSPDPVRGSIGDPQSFNAYGYAGNDPVNLVDASGLWADASNGEGAGCRVDGIPVNCGMAFSLINMGAAYIRSGAGFYLEGRVLIFDRITREYAGYTYWNAFLMDPQEPYSMEQILRKAKQDKLREQALQAYRDCITDNPDAIAAYNQYSGALDKVFAEQMFDPFALGELGAKVGYHSLRGGALLV